MDISVVILTWNSEAYLSNCIRSLIADISVCKFSYEIFIVDNGSKDCTIEIIESFSSKYPDNIIPIYLKKNTGTTYSRNLALKKTKGKIVVIMDSDVEVLKGTFNRLITTLRENEVAGIVVPRLIYPDGTLQKSTDVFPTFFTKIYRFLVLKIVEKKQNRTKKEDKLREVNYAISAVWVLKRDILVKVGLLDENIFYAPEDVDFCLRVWQAGYKIIYDPMATAIHHTQEISRGLKINKATLHHIKGLFYFFRKHNCFFRRPRICKLS